jgi:hypothetical protein
LQAGQFGSGNWFAAGSTIQQQKPVCCWHHNFDSECYFAAANTFSAANSNSLQITQFQWRVTNSMQTIKLQQ